MHLRNQSVISLAKALLVFLCYLLYFTKFWRWRQEILILYSPLLIQAIQDITRKYDIPPEEIVELIYTRIDVNGEGKRKDSHDKYPN